METWPEAAETCGASAGGAEAVVESGMEGSWLCVILGEVTSEAVEEEWECREVVPSEAGEAI